MSAINKIVLNGTEYTISESGGGLTDSVKQALLQIASKIAYVDNGGQDYYGALEDALYPPADLVSISAVYTQSEPVYDSDTLNSLRSDLVVTAHMSDSSTRTVTTYTLSGTLTEGTSTITVAYGGKTTTFNVTVSSNMLYNWDFTQSLIDTKSGREAILRGTNTAPTRTSNGLVFDAATQNADLGSLDVAGKTIEIDVASFQFAGDTAQHIRFVMSPPDAAHGGYGALIYQASTGWKAYGKNASATGNMWSDNYSGLGGDTSTIRNIFSGKTVKLVFASDSNSVELFLNDESKGTINSIDISAFSGLVIGGGYNAWAVGSGDQCYNMTITGVRVYANA